MKTIYQVEKTAKKVAAARNLEKALNQTDWQVVRLASMKYKVFSPSLENSSLIEALPECKDLTALKELLTQHGFEVYLNLGFKESLIHMDAFSKTCSFSLCQGTEYMWLDPRVTYRIHTENQALKTALAEVISNLTYSEG